MVSSSSFLHDKRTAGENTDSVGRTVDMVISRPNENWRPKVLFVGAFPPPGHQVYGGFVTDCPALLRSSLPDRVVFDLLDSTQISNPAPNLAIRFLLAGKRLGRYLRKLVSGRPDAVLLFCSAGASLMEKGLMAWIARISGRPALLFPRQGLVMDEYRASKGKKFAIGTAFQGARAILCQGAVFQDFAVNELGFEKADAPIITNWTASDELLQIGLARKPTSGRARRVVFLGWLEEKKGIIELIRGFAAISQKEVVLDLIGDGHLRNQAEALAIELSVADRVVFHGWKSGNARDEILAAADIFILPSFWEGLPNAMVEAMATRLPVIVTPVGTITSYIKDGENGFFVEPRSVPAITAALDRLIEDDTLRRRLADAAFETARKEFSVEAASDKLAAAIHRYTRVAAR